MKWTLLDLPELKIVPRRSTMIFLWIGMLLAIPFLSFGYEIGSALAEVTVSGQVTSMENGEPIPGVNVQVKGTSAGTFTDPEGNYTITVDEDAVLVFSFLGFQSQEVQVNGRSTIDVILLADLSELDRVVVVGYGTQKKASLTGSIVDVGGETLEKAPVSSLSNSLAGRLPGVIGLNRSGQPGANGSEILIRGTSTLGETGPLFVIDGVPGRQGFDQIDPRDIESVSVLKDASAAIYGARAANGVILITTKRGSLGKPMIRYSFNQGIVQPTRLPEYADAATLAEFQNAQLEQGGQTPKFTEEEIEKFRNGTDPVRYPNTDWIESMLKEFSTQSRHSLSLRGGTETIKYYLSGNYSNQDGMFKDGITNSKVLGTRSNIDANVTDNIKLSLDLSIQETNNKYPAASAGTIIEQMYRNYSYLADFYPNGLPGAGYSENRNPRLLVTDAHGYRDNKINLYQIKAAFDINIAQVEGLGLDGFIAYDKTQTRNKTFEKPAFVYRYDAAGDTYEKTSAGQILTPQLEERYDFASSLILHAKVRYQRTFGDHFVNGFVAAEQAENKSSYFSAFRRDFLSSKVDQLFAGGAANQLTDGSAAEFNRRNFFGRFSYEYKGKYLFDLNMRYDGSSAFPKDKRWGFFPGVSAGWRISEEPFFKNTVGFVDNLKIRGSWGQMGNDAIDPFQYLTNYLLVPGYIFGEENRLNTGIIQGVEPNPNITWEVATSTNIGLDAGLWNNKLGITFDIFKSRRSNILTQKSASIPIYTGLELPLENIGIVENKGFELALTHRGGNLGQLNYSIGGNVAVARNEVIDIDEPATIIEWQQATGHSMNTTLYYDAIGIYRTQAEIDNSPHPLGTIVGDLQYRDVDGNGQIDDNDRVRMDKTNTPEITFGMNVNLGYKNFSLSFLLQGQSRSWGYYYIPQGLFGNVLAEMVNNRPTPDNPDSKYPNLTYDESQVSAYVSDFWLRNSSFLRLKTVELGYNLPQSFLGRVGVENARIYLNGFNLLTFDSLKWFDPEGNEDRAAHYPQNKIYNLGINVTF